MVPHLNPPPNHNPPSPSEQQSCSSLSKIMAEDIVSQVAGLINLVEEKNQENIRLKARIAELEAGKTGYLAMVRGRTLPPEIVDMVTVYLHDDKRSLLSYTLVSRTWLHSSRPQLWHTISVAANAESFVPFLCERPHLCQYICDLSLHGTTGASSDVYPNDRPGLRPTTIHSILSYLPQIRILTLQTYRYGKLYASDMHLQDRFRLDQLCIRDCGHWDWGKGKNTYYDIVGFLGFFSQIGVLQLHHVAWDEAPLDVPESLGTMAPPPRIHSVVGAPDDIAMTATLDYLLDILQPKHALHSIELYPRSGSEVDNLQQLIREVGQNLVHLLFELNIGGMAITGHDWHYATIAMGEELNQCSNLRSLGLRLPCYDEFDEHYDDSEQVFYRSVFRMISRCQQSLHQIALHFHGYDPLHLWENEQRDPIVDWAGATETFRRFKMLERVVIHFHGDEVEGFRSGTCGYKVDEIVRAFARDAPKLAAVKIFELGLNSSLFNLHDGTKIPDEPLYRCKASECWGRTG